MSEGLAQAAFICGQIFPGVRPVAMRLAPAPKTTGRNHPCPDPQCLQMAHMRPR